MEKIAGHRLQEWLDRMTTQQEQAINVMLGSQAMTELDRLFKQTHRTYALALQAVRDGDRDLAQLACNLEDKMDRKYWKARKRLSKRLEAGKINAEADTVYMKVLRNLERISDHADNLGINVMRA